MPVQCTLGALSTFKLDPGEKEGFVSLITGTNYLQYTAIVKDIAINNNIVVLTGCSNVRTQFVKLDNANSIPNVNFVSTYRDTSSTAGGIASSIYIDSNNQSTLISTENVNFSNNNIRSLVIRTIDSNNNLLYAYANPPNSSNANANINQVYGIPLIDSNSNNIIVSFAQTLPNLTPNAQPVVKSFNNIGNIVNWTKDFRIGNTRQNIFLQDFSSNTILAATSNTIFDISSDGNTVSNVVSFVGGVGPANANIVSSIITVKSDNTSNRYAIVAGPSASNRYSIIRLNGNSISYEIKGNLNSASAIFRSLAVAGNNFYVISDNLANPAIDPRFVNVACFDTNSGNNIWQKNIRIANTTSTYCNGQEIQVNSNNIYILGSISDASLNASGSFVVKIPDTGNTLYNFYNLGNSGYTISITNGNNIFSSDNLGTLTTPASIVVNNANLVNTFSIVDSTNTTQSWTYVSTDI